MELLKPIGLFVRSLSPKEFNRLAAGYLGAFIALFGLLVYFHYSAIGEIEDKMKHINVDRRKARVILSQDLEIKKQKEAVDKILQKRKSSSFKLLNYFDFTTRKFHLSNNLKNRPTVVTSPLNNLRNQGYTEVKLTANLININMKQLVELLAEIEQYDIIYIKSLEVVKSGKNRVINVILTIATLQFKPS